MAPCRQVALSEWQLLPGKYEWDLPLCLAFSSRWYFQIDAALNGVGLVRFNPDYVLLLLSVITMIFLYTG